MFPFFLSVKIPNDEFHRELKTLRIVFHLLSVMREDRSYFCRIYVLQARNVSE